MESDRARGGWRILSVGTGGQGVLTAAHLLSRFFVAKGHDVVSGQVHGMAQRGGSVQSSVMVDCGMSPVIPQGKADFVLGLEPFECARALPLVSSRSTVFMNEARVTPFVVAQDRARHRDEGPTLQEIQKVMRAVTPHFVSVDATALAERAGSTRTLNVVMLGALFGSERLPYAPEDFIDVVPLSEENARAFQRGVEFGRTVP